MKRLGFPASKATRYGVPGAIPVSRTRRGRTQVWKKYGKPGTKKLLDRYGSEPGQVTR
jgi:hypothetical protein